MIELHLEPSDEQRPHLHRRLPPLRNSYLCMSGRTKIMSIKKYLVQKLGIKESRSSVSDICPLFAFDIVTLFVNLAMNDAYFRLNYSAMGIPWGMN